ncbi:MAG: hypothetical protein ACIAQF_10465 [Phycisphaerales bacterium JB065]
MQPNTLSQRARLLPSRSAAAAVLSAATLLGAAAPSALAWSDGWEHYDVAAPKTITLEFDSDMLAFDLCWSEHTEMTKEQIVNAAVAQMTNPAQLHVLDLPGLPPFYRRTSNASVWRDLEGEVIRASDILPNRRNYHVDVEQALIDIAGRIRDARPGAKLAFKGFEIQPLPGRRPPAYEQLGEVQDFYITDRTIYLNHVGGLLDRALNSTFYRVRVDFVNSKEKWLVFPNQTGQFSLASLTTPDWPPAEFEPEILALWGVEDQPEGNQQDVPDLPPGDFAVLQPGSGWSGPTAEPAPIGQPSDLGYDAKAIARWDVVPFQTFDEAFDIGVVAFHMNGIQRVDFAVDGGSWVSVNAPEYNARTGVMEYTVRLEPALFEDGPIEVRAIAYPVVGEPRVLDSLELFANPDGSLTGQTVYVSHDGTDAADAGSQESPFKTIAYAINRVGMGGEVILLDPGFYSLEGSAPAMQTNERWITVRGRDGLDRDDVVLGMPDDERKIARLKANRVRYNNLTLDFGTIRQFYSEWNQHYWFDDILWTDSNGWAQEYEDHSGINNYCRTRGDAGQHGWFATDSLAYNVTYGFSGAELVRNTHSERVSGDVFKDTQAVINATIRKIDGRVKDHHTDIIQIYSLQPNAIYYNISGYDNTEAQNIFTNSSTEVRDTAFVNIAILNESGHVGSSQLNCPHNHVLFLHVSMAHQSLIFRDDWSDDRKFVANNVVIANSLVNQLSRGNFGWEGLPSGVVAYNNHFVTGQLRGISPSTGPVDLVMSTPSRFNYSGAAVSYVTGSGTPVPNLPVIEWDYGSSVAPNRGAFPVLTQFAQFEE